MPCGSALTPSGRIFAPQGGYTQPGYDSHTRVRYRVYLEYIQYPTTANKPSDMFCTVYLAGSGSVDHKATPCVSVLTSSGRISFSPYRKSRCRLRCAWARQVSEVESTEGVGALL